MDFEFYLLGKMLVRNAEGEERAPTQTRKSAVLAYLACAPGLHRRDALAQRFWPKEPNETARAGLRAAIRALQQEYAPHLTVVEDLVGFQPDAGIWVDARAFQELLALAERADDPEPTLERGLALYRDEFLCGFHVRGCNACDEWQRMQAVVFHQQAVEGYLRLLRLRLTNGRTREGIATARRLIEIDPYNDEGHLLLMRLQLRDGQIRAAEQTHEGYTVTRWTELGAGPEPTMQALYVSLRRPRSSGQPTKSAPGVTPLVRKQHYVPAPPYLIGREAELRQVTQALLHPANRLVTLLGLGGVGKTWLAMSAAHRLEAAFANGAVFLPLVGVGPTPDEIASVIALALDVTFAATGSPAHQILGYLRGRELLLVLDNFEHLLPAVGFIEQLLAVAPRLKLLVTSQVALNLQNEIRFPVLGLTLPPSDAGEASVMSSDAVRLFTFQAARINPATRIAGPAIADVAAICRAVEGHPLAIEQAASWVGHLSLPEILSILTQRPAELPAMRQHLPPRQRSLDAAFEYSWRLLTREQQRLLAQTSVFPSRFDRTALHAVTGGSLGNVADLTDRAILTVVEEACYQLHTLWRQMALDKLRSEFEPALEAETAARHGAYYLRLTARMGEQLLGEQSASSRNTLRQFSLNIEQAAKWAVMFGTAELITPAAATLEEFLVLEAQTEAATLLLKHALAGWRKRADVPPAQAALVEAILASGLARFLTLRGLTDEAAEPISRVSRLLAGAEASPHVFYALRNIAWASLDAALEGLPDLLERMRRMAAALQDPAARAESLLLDSLWETRQGEADAAGAHLLEALAGFEAAGQFVRAAECHTRLGQLFAARLAQLARAREHLEKALALCARLRLPYREIVAAQTLGIVAYSEGDYEGAKQQLLSVIARYQELDLQIQVTRAQIQLGVAMVDLGGSEDAALYEEALALGGQAADAAAELGNTQLQAYAHYVIGSAYHALGQLAAARDAFEDGIALARQVDAGEILEILFGPLIMVYLDLGRPAEAERIGSELAARLGDPADESRFGHAYCGYLAAETGELQTAIRRLSATPGLYDANPSAQPWFAVAMLAEVRLRLGECESALALVSSMLAHAATRPLHATTHPGRTYLACHRVLAAQNDPRAVVVLVAAQRWLRTSAQKIGNPAWRKSFVETIPAHRELRALQALSPDPLRDYKSLTSFSF